MMSSVPSEPPNGMYIQYYQIDNKAISYSNLYFIDINLNTKTCQFFSAKGDLIETTDLLLQGNKVICPEAKLQIEVGDSDKTVKIIFLENMNEGAIFYQKIDAVSRDNADKNLLAEDKVKEINGFLFFKYQSQLGANFLFPITAIKDKSITYINLKNMKTAYYNK